MTNAWQLKSFMLKNLRVRNIIATILGLVFPIVLMVLLYLMRKTVIFQISDEPSDNTDFFQTYCSALVDSSNASGSSDYLNGITIRKPL